MKTTLLLAGALLVAGCASGPEPLSMEDTVQVSAAVSQIDAARRQMSIRTDAGEEFALDVHPEVRNLPQVKVGDRVVVRYKEAIGASIRKSGDPAAPTIDLSADRAKAGAMPAGSIRRTATVPVQIIAVDTRKNVVTFYDADRLVRTLPIVRPEAQAWVSQLKAGDEVIVTYTQSIALAVEPAK